MTTRKTPTPPEYLEAAAVRELLAYVERYRSEPLADAFLIWHDYRANVWFDAPLEPDECEEVIGWLEDYTGRQA